MLGYVKKSNVLEIIKRERDLNFDMYERYIDIVNTATDDDFRTAYTNLAADAFSSYQECCHLISKIEKL